MAMTPLEKKVRELEAQSGTLTQEELIARFEAEIKPLWEQEIRAHGGHEPDWAPLEMVLPYRWCAGFMFMGYEGEIRIYKQGFTRKCLYADPIGNTFRRSRFSFKRIDREDAIEDVFEGIEDMGFARSTEYNEANAQKRRELIEKDTGYKIVSFNAGN